MASKKVISVNESSLVDLKAELYRKETQLKREKVDNGQPKKTPIWQKKKKESKRKDGKTASETTTLQDSSYEKQLEKSRLMLEAKSALYNKLSNGEIEVPSDEDEQDGRFLVDFHQKTIPKISEVDSSEQEILPAVNPDDEWVEYVDSFGRSKMCLRKDLPQMKEKDEKVKLKSLEERKLTLLSDDMRREMIRKRWEEEVQEALDKPVGPVHYQDILFDETRDHGVGYYKFSKDEEERQEQQSALNKLRAQTEQQRNKREKLLEKRKAVMDARLAKIRERKQRKLHETGADEHTQDQEKKTEKTSSETNEESDEMFVGAMVERIRNKTTRIEKAHLNEWERGKVDLETFEKPTRKTPSYDPRSERNPEFAPPSFYTNEKKDWLRKSKWKPEKHTVDLGTDVQTPKHRGDALNNQETDSQSTQHDFDLNNQPLEMHANNTDILTPQTSITQNYQPSFDSSASAQNTNAHFQSTNPSIANTNPNLHNTNVYDQNTNVYDQNTNVYDQNTNVYDQNTNVYDQNTNVYDQNTNVYDQNTNPYVHNTFHNLPPPPIHIFPPPNFPPPPFPFPPQYPPNTQFPPNYPSYPPPQ